jgi:hypothetical protein
MQIVCHNCPVARLRSSLSGNEKWACPCDGYPMILWGPFGSQILPSFRLWQDEGHGVFESSWSSFKVLRTCNKIRTRDRRRQILHPRKFLCQGDQKPNKRFMMKSTISGSDISSESWSSTIPETMLLAGFWKEFRIDLPEWKTGIAPGTIVKIHELWRLLHTNYKSDVFTVGFKSTVGVSMSVVHKIRPDVQRTQIQIPLQRIPMGMKAFWASLSFFRF